MEINKQIKKYRTELKLSQEDLAKKAFVTRQTISNWENSKSYPDINSLVLLSTIFGVSLDILIKGDLEKMKEEIKAEDVRKFNKDSNIFAALLIISLLSIVPLFKYLKFVGVGIWGVIYATAMYWSFRVEKQKKTHDIKTYKEVVAFTNGKKLDEIEKIRESGKRSYQTILFVIFSALIAVLVTFVMLYLFS